MPPPANALRTRTSRLLVAAALLALVAAAYLPGLRGPFVFDDFGNLDVLGAFGPVDDWRTFLYYITSGQADPTGRPVALLTFLLDAQAWPADPWPFKRTNLVLHLLDTALLALAIHRLQAGLQRRWPARAFSPWTPLLAAGLWGAHPFFVSTTLYAVQREAMLPMSFVLLALLAWDRAVSRFEARRNTAGWAWAILGVGTCTVLATLSKANGALAPLLVGLAHLCCLRPAAQPHRSAPGWSGMAAADRAAWLCLGLPSALLLAYLLRTGLQLWSLPELAARDWTLPERLLSQPRALWSYLGQLALPRAGGGGVYVEDFVASRGWLHPPTTLPALLALVASVVAAVGLRRRFPIASFAWLFFLAAHLLESTVIPLELYFEHRNYLPAMFLGWPLAHALLRPAPYPRARIALALGLLAGLLLLTHQRAVAWGDEALLAALPAQQGAGSARAQIEAAQSEIERGQRAQGLARIAAVQRRHPLLVEAAVNAISLECAATGNLADATLQRSRATLENTRRWNYALYLWLQRAIETPSLRDCHGFGLRGLEALLDALDRNPLSAEAQRQRDIVHIRGRLALARGDPGGALARFDAALRSQPDADYALVQAALLGGARAPTLGLAHLDTFARLEQATQAAPLRDMAALHRRVLRRYGYYRDALAHLRAQLQREAAQGDAARQR